MDQKIPEPLSKPVEPTKPRANVAPEQAHAAMATSTPMGTPAANVGKSSKVKSLLIGFIILLLVVGCVSMGYMLWKAQRDIDILNADHKAALEEMDKKRAELEAQIKEMKGGETPKANNIIMLPDTNLGFVYEDYSDLTIYKTNYDEYYSITSKKVVATNEADGEPICSSMSIHLNLPPGDGPVILSQKKIGDDTYTLMQSDGPGMCPDADQAIQKQVVESVKNAFESLKQYMN